MENRILFMVHVSSGLGTGKIAVEMQTSAKRRPKVAPRLPRGRPKVAQRRPKVAQKSPESRMKVAGKSFTSRWKVAQKSSECRPKIIQRSPCVLSAKESDPGFITKGKTCVSPSFIVSWSNRPDWAAGSRENAVKRFDHFVSDLYSDRIFSRG